MKKIACLLLLNLWVLNVQAADNNWLDELKQLFQSYWTKQQPEKIYLHTDRSFYAAGDTVWFKAYLTDAKTKELRLVPEVIYLNLISPGKKAVLSKRLKAELGTLAGSLVLPDTLPKGSYLVQANTNWQRNSGQSSFCQQVIYINTPEPGVANLPAYSRKGVLKDVQLFPEGGRLLVGFDGKVGIKTIAEDGAGISAEGKVLDEAGKVVAGFRSDADGLGSFKFKPLANKNYVVQILSDSKVKNFPLTVLQKGYALNVKSQPDSVYISMVASPEIKQSGIYLVVQSQGTLVVSDSVLWNPNGMRKLKFSTKSWPEGVTQIALLNAQGIMEAERLFFQGKKQQVKVHLSTPKKAFGRREPVQVSLELQDENNKPIEAELSVSVLGNGVMPALSLRSNLLFTSEISGTVPFPGKYLENAQAMDNLLLTQSVRNFSWKGLVEKAQATIAFPRETELKDQGIALADNAAIGQAVIYLLNTETGKTHIATTDASGKFTLPAGNATRYFYQVWQNGLVRQNAVLSYLNAEPVLPANNNWDTAFDLDSVSSSRFLLQQRIRKAYGLETKPGQATNEKKNNWLTYQADKSYLLENYNEFATMEEIFKEIVPSVRIINKKGVLQANMLNSDRKDFFAYQPLYIIDGQPTWNNDLFLRLDATQVKLVDVFYSSKSLMPFGFMGNQGVIALQTKNGNYQNPELKTEHVLNVPSQQPVSEFVTKSAPAHIPDFRPTLYWNPKLQTNAEGKASINFQTSDEMGNLRVQVEGITKDGKMVSGQLLIPVQPAE